MQTILGAGGAIGTELAKELPRYTTRIRLVSRHPGKVNDTDEVYAANLLDPAQVTKAVEGSEIVYLTAGLQYKTKVWQQQWPVLMKNVIDACTHYKSKLVFFDNIYMYDPDHLAHLTEETPIRPVSKKGIVRAQIAQMVMDAVQRGELTAMIVRSADFIGLKNSVLIETVAKNFLKGKKANWMVDATKIHTFTFVPDAAKATALAANTANAYNQVWHLPTDRTPLTGEQWIELFAKETDVMPRYSILSKRMMGVLGMFIPTLREFKEMSYQFERDYVLDSSKFEQRFSFTATPPQESVRQIIRELKQHPV